MTTLKSAPVGATEPETQPTPRTTLPDRTGPTGQQTPRHLGTIRTTDVLSLIGALAASLTMTGLLWTQLSPFTGVLGYVVTSWILFVLGYALLVSFDENRPTMWDRVTSLVVHSLAVVLLGVLVFVIYYTFDRGWSAIVHSNFFTQDLRNAGPLDPLTVGGIKHAIVGTLIEIGITLSIAVPLGLLGAVFLHEVPGRFSRFVRTVVEAMTALPDILAGLFIYATLILILGFDSSGFAASCALAVTILPIIIRAGDVVLRLVPGNLTEASYALGAGQWRTVWHILLPTARSGLATAVILGAARAIGETSPVLLTAGFTADLNTNPLHGPMVSLPLEAYEAVQSPEPAMIARGFGSAATLLVLVLVLFAVARKIGGRGAGQLTVRQRRRRVRASSRDRDRFAARNRIVDQRQPLAQQLLGPPPDTAT
ncbi:MAG TPA: phosphate ABC transporter permease PstA [Pseudonocardiaceae bacterium]|jgi:phosphate transport system permease protein|nr:phosphate ABC transporter permease PstA [Pseudonocardiaceae bacterium]